VPVLGSTLQKIIEGIDSTFPSSVKDEVATANYGPRPLDEKYPEHLFPSWVKSNYLEKNESVIEYLASEGLENPTRDRVSEVLYQAYRSYLIRAPIDLDSIIKKKNLEYWRMIKPEPYVIPQTGEKVIPKREGVIGRNVDDRRIHYGISEGGKQLWGYEYEAGWYPIEPCEVGGNQEYEKLLKNEKHNQSGDDIAE